MADAARDCVKMFNSELRGFSFLNRLARFCSIDFERDLQQPVAGDMEDWASQWVEKVGLHTNVKSSILRTLRREPWLSRCRSTLIFVDCKSSYSSLICFVRLFLKAVLHGSS